MSLTSLVTSAQASLQAVEVAVMQAKADLAKVKAALDLGLSSQSQWNALSVNSSSQDRELWSVWQPESASTATNLSPPISQLEGSYPSTQRELWPSQSLETWEPQSEKTLKSVWNVEKMPTVKGPPSPVPSSVQTSVFSSVPIPVPVSVRSPSDPADSLLSWDADLGLSHLLSSALPGREQTASSWAAICRKPQTESPTITSVQCSQCHQPRNLCQDGKPLLLVQKQTIGRKIMASGSSWPKVKLGRVATVMGVGNGGNILLKWENCSRLESFTIVAKGVPKFSLHCAGEKHSVAESLAVGEIDMEGVSSLVRLPVKPFIPEVWAHDHLGEKHRLIISADQDINLVAIGLVVETAIPRIVLSICHKNDHFDEHNSIFSQNFSMVSSSKAILKLDRKVLLTGDKPFMLVLHIFGGSSQVRYGGEESSAVTMTSQGNRTVVGLRFANYWHKDDVSMRSTRVEKGLVEKLYVEK